MCELRTTLALLVALLLVGCSAKQAVDPLPSWNEGTAKQNIINFVDRVTDAASDDYVPPEDRIATFDNDGTLWAEQPVYFQLLFAFDRIRSMASDHPEWAKDTLLAAVIDSDIHKALQTGHEGLARLLMLSHTGMSTDEFAEIVLGWISNAPHPSTGKLLTEMVYQPMLELLDYLRANEFETFIVSGGGIEFMRPWAYEVYGIPPQNVVGSSVVVEFEMQNGVPMLIRKPEINFIDDQEGKPVGINQHIGKRPIAAFGNSDGDLQMLQWTAAGDGPSLMVYVHHTDGEREWAYDRESSIGRLDAGLDEAYEKGWTVIDMRTDWSKVFPFED